MTGARPPRAREVAEGLSRLEGYLLCQAELRAARTAAEDFAGRLPWLTAAQRAEVVRLYAEERLAVSRRTWQTIAHRCEELRREYTHRYAVLRRRLCGACAALLVAVGSLVAAVLLAVGGG